jgi:hypothetical protein
LFSKKIAKNVEVTLGKHNFSKNISTVLFNKYKNLSKRTGCKQAIHYGTMALPLYDKATIKI